jgi:hypothetical protein
MTSHLLRLAFAGVVATAAATAAAQTVNGVVAWGWPVAGPFWPGFGAPVGACAIGGCTDGPALRRAIQREITRMQFLSELDARSNATFGHIHRTEAPPPTPDAHIQPAYRGSGEILPQFRQVGEPRTR